jgi:hypothetical protein
VIKIRHKKNPGTFTSILSMAIVILLSTHKVGDIDIILVLKRYIMSHIYAKLLLRYLHIFEGKNIMTWK